MSFLPDFTDDLFISYAHVDNLPLRKGAEGWITLLHNSLETRLRQLLGQKVVVWRDRKLHGNDEFGDELIERLNKVGLLISILSPSYVTSKWCVKEMQEFCAAAERNGGLKLGNKSRLFKVVKTPVPRERHPAEMGGQLGYQFYVDEDDNRFRELIGDLQDKVFWDIHEDLAQNIRETIDLIRGQRTGPSGATVYVAYSSSDVPERDRLVRELRALGHQILPQGPLPITLPDFAQATRECLARSQLAIHLIGGRYGIVPEGETRSVIELQERLAADVAASSGIDRILWIRPNAVVKEEIQIKFIQRLEHEVAEQRGVELIRAEYEDLKSFVTDRLSAPKKDSCKAKKRTGIQVYLIHASFDGAAVKPLDDRLFERGYEVLRPIAKGTPTQRRDTHKEDLLSCDAVLIYQGDADEFWLRTKLRDLEKAPGYGRSAPFMAKGIFVGPSRTAFKEQFRRHDALVMKSLDAVVPDALQPFLAQLESPRSEAG